jgi:hypothetical protein
MADGKLKTRLATSLEDGAQGLGLELSEREAVSLLGAIISIIEQTHILISREPTETDIEAVARAIAVADGKDPDAPAWVRYPGAEPFGLCWRDQYQDKARAAHAALVGKTDAGP